VVATVLAHLLPEAVEGGGALVLVAFAAALAAPGAIARIATWGGGGAHDHRLATELAYASLLLHKVTDGVALGAAVAPGQPRHWDVIAAIAAHTVPMAAVVALAYRDRPRTAWLRALGLAAAIAAGAALADAAAVTVLADATPWLAAVASGLLLHVVTHDLPAGGSRGAADRALELAAIAAGLALPLVFREEGSAPGVGAAALAIARAIAPAILAGLVASAIVQALLGRAVGRARTAAGGALAGAALPGCACAAVPGAIELAQHGTPRPAATAAAFAAPAAGGDALLASASLFGAPLAACRLAASFVIAAVTGAIAGAGPAPREAAALPDEPELLHGGLAHRAITALDELVTHAAPWLVAGVAAAALLIGTRLDDLSPIATIAIALAVAIPARVALAAAVPPAAALVAAGFPAGAAIAALAVAPALHPRAIGLVRREAGPARAIAATAVALAIAVVLALVAPAPRAAFDPPRALADACFAALGLLAVRSLWRSGAAAWIAALHGHGQHGRTHDERHAGDGAAPPPADHHGLHHEHGHDDHDHAH
jgi:uncharacterized membrane protein YraQ (UPF0718 family)